MLSTLAPLILTVPVAPAPSIVHGLSAIADRYDVIFLDQFGVLHDGQKPLKGAIDCFNALRANGKRLVVLSNTSRRRSFAIKKLPSLGYDEAALDGFVTSGEAAWDHMAKNHRGARVLWISWDDAFHAWDSAYLDGLDVTLADAETADVVLLQGSQVLRDGSSSSPASTGIFAAGEPSAALTAALATCAARGLEMICANPDFTVTLPDGQRGYMPGCIAQLYEEQHAGAVTYFGKPHGPAFAAARAVLGPDAPPPHRVLHVGDSLLHDVAGANAAGVHSLFVAGGIHAEQLGVPETRAADAGEAEDDANAELTPEALTRLFDETGVRPTLSIPTFVW